MSFFKYIAQIIGSVIYTSIFVMIMAALAFFPIAWLCSLPWWGIVLVLLVGSSILFFLVSFIHTVAMLPYVWLVSHNKVAYILTILAFIFNTIRYSIGIWEFDDEGDNWFLFTKIIMILSLLGMACASLYGVTHAYNDEDENY